jgi:ubiquilin
MANMLENPAVLSTMNEALNNPAFIDYMIESNPMLRNMPNAREMLQSPYFRNMMTNPESIRAAARMRRAMGQGGGPAAFPAPGATDTTPADAPSSNATTGNNNAAQPPNPLGLQGMFPGLGGGFGGPNDFMHLFGGMPPMPQANPAAGSNPASPPAAGTSPVPEQRNATGSPTPNATGGNNAQTNPFAALFGGLPGAAGGGAAGQDPFTAFGLPTPTPEQIQQVMQLMGGAGGAGAGLPGGLGGLGGFGGFGSPTAASPPPDTRPPEERYADQLRQLNDMGFFDFERNVEALRRSGGSVQGAIEHLLG